MPIAQEHRDAKASSEQGHGHSPCGLGQVTDSLLVGISKMKLREPPSEGFARIRGGDAGKCPAPGEHGAAASLLGQREAAGERAPPPPPGGVWKRSCVAPPPSVGKVNRWRPLALESLCFSRKGRGPRAGGDPLEGRGRELGCVLPGTRGPSPRPQSPREARGGSPNQ